MLSKMWDIYVNAIMNITVYNSVYICLYLLNAWL